MPTLYSTTMASPIGSLFLAASEKGLIALEFDFKPAGKSSVRRSPRPPVGEHDKIVCHEFPVSLLARADSHSVWRDPHVWRSGPRNPKAERVSRSRHGQQSQSNRDRCSVPSRDRLG